MAFSPDVAVSIFAPDELRQLATDLGVETMLSSQLLREAGEFAETEFLAAAVCSILEELEVQGTSVAEYVAAVATARSVRPLAPLGL